MNNRVFALVFSSLALLSVAACSKDPAPAPNAQAAADDNLAEVAHNGSENMQKQREAMRKARESNPAADPFDTLSGKTKPAHASSSPSAKR